MLTYCPPTTERVSYLRSIDHAPLRNICGSCLRSLSASALFFAAHALPSGGQSAAGGASALILASSETPVSMDLVLMVKSGLGSAARAANVKLARNIARPILFKRV